jgi:hypothetical protein
VVGEPSAVSLTVSQHDGGFSTITFPLANDCDHVPRLVFKMLFRGNEDRRRRKMHDATVYSHPLLPSPSKSFSEQFFLQGECQEGVNATASTSTPQNVAVNKPHCQERKKRTRAASFGKIVYRG